MFRWVVWVIARSLLFSDVRSTMCFCSRPPHPSQLLPYSLRICFGGRRWLQAIEIKKSEQQDYMDKIMREARDKPADPSPEAAAEPAPEADAGDDVDDLDALLHKEL